MSWNWMKNLTVRKIWQNQPIIPRPILMSKMTMACSAKDMASDIQAFLSSGLAYLWMCCFTKAY